MILVVITNSNFISLGKPETIKTAIYLGFNLQRNWVWWYHNIFRLFTALQYYLAFNGGILNLKNNCLNCSPLCSLQSQVWLWPQTHCWEPQYVHGQGQGSTKVKILWQQRFNFMQCGPQTKIIDFNLFSISEYTPPCLISIIFCLKA